MWLRLASTKTKSALILTPRARAASTAVCARSTEASMRNGDPSTSAPPMTYRPPPQKPSTIVRLSSRVRWLLVNVRMYAPM